MKKPEDILNSKKIKKVLNNFSSDKRKVFEQFVYDYTEDCRLPNRIKCFVDILNNNTSNYFDKYEIYMSSPSSYAAKEARYGPEYVKKHRENLLNRPKIDRSKQNNYDPNFLARVHNISLTEAENLVRQRKEKNSVHAKKLHKELKEKGYSYRDNNPLCIEYWLAREYDSDTAEKLHRNYIEKTRTNKRGFELRRGREKADKLFNQWVNKRRNTWLEKYGTTVPISGKTSKESINFFIPLYKKLRRLGLQREDIYWGIGGSKEYANRSDDLGNFFFDFTIKSLKYIVEYHGSFWHPQPDVEFKGFIDEKGALDRDYAKKKHMESLGYKVVYVWDFEDHAQRIDEILSDVLERRSNRRNTEDIL